jgi:cytochrome b subunit of formate dehydrogenase
LHLPPIVYLEQARHQRVLLVERVMHWVALLGVLVLLLAGLLSAMPG